MIHKTLQLRIRRSDMSYFICWCLLLGSFGVVLSGNLTEDQRGEEIRKWLDDHPEFVKKYLGKEIVAYRGMSVNLFPDVPVDQDISVYVNGKENSRIIARLETENGVKRNKWWIEPEYLSKIYIDKNANIWLCNLDQNDARTYYIIYGVNMRGPNINLTILEDAMGENHPEVCWSSHPNSTEKYFGKLTDEQVWEEIRKWLDERPEYIKKYLGKLAEEQIGEEILKWLYNHPEYFKKYFGKVMPEQILQMLCNHPQEVLKEPSGKLTEKQIGEEIPKWLDSHPEYFKKYFGSWNPPNQELLIVTCILQMILLLCILLANRIHIRDGCINMKHWIHKRLYSQQRSENLSQIEETVIPMEEQEKWTDDQIREQMQKCLGVYPMLMEKCLEKLTDDQFKEQMQKCLGVYPMLMEKYLGNLTEDQIWEQIQKWQDVYPGHFIKKYLESLKEDQVQKWLNDHPDFMDTYLGKLTEDQIWEQIQKWQNVYPGHFMKKYHDELEKDDPDKTPTLDELAVTLCEPGSGTEDNQRQLELSQEVITSSTCNSPSSGTFNKPGHSGSQPFNTDEQDADPGWDMGQTDMESLGVLAKEDSDSLPDEESREPLLKDYGGQKLRSDKRRPSTHYKKATD